MARYHLEGGGSAAIAASVEREVAAGRLQPGEQLPPVRTLAAQLGVSANTVAAAYRRLRDRGVVDTDGRRGTRVRPRPATTARPRVAPPLPPGIDDLASGNPDPALLPRADAAVVAALADPVLRYDPPAVAPALARVVRSVLEVEGVPGEHLAVVSGAVDGIERVLTARLRPGDRVAVEDPAWAHVLDLLAATGLVPEPVAIDDDGPVPEDLARALDQGCAAAVVTCRAQNPYGAAIGAERARALRSVLRARPGVLLVEDDHAGEVAGAGMEHLAGATERWAHVRSVSKALGPDLRLAVLAGDAETVDAVMGRQRLGPGWVSHLLQRTVAALWADPATAALLGRAAATYSRRRDRLLTELDRRGVPAHGRSGLNVWVPVADETTAVTHLTAAGWAVTAGARFRIRSAPAVRVTVAELDESRAVALAEAIAVAASARTGRRVV